ncbi:MAG: hypothetical protein JWO36_3453 [Myxococcales bacterium]|nr:hypothetical protein [Myxococcales bacterium]
MILVLLAGIAGVAIVAYLGLRGGTKTKPAVRQEVESGSSVSPAVALETTAEITPAGSAAAAAPNPGALASKLEGTLRKQRLWSTVEVVGDHADVRSGSCNDPAMLAALATAATSFKAAGLTKLRCLEQSGHVVLARDL